MANGGQDPGQDPDPFEQYKRSILDSARSEERAPEGDDDGSTREADDDPFETFKSKILQSARSDSAPPPSETGGDDEGGPAPAAPADTRAGPDPGGRFGLGLDELDLPETDEPSGLQELRDIAEQVTASTAEFSTELVGGAAELTGEATEMLPRFGVGAGMREAGEEVGEAGQALQEKGEETREIIGPPETAAGRMAGVASRLGLEGLALAAGAQASGVPRAASLTRRVGQGVKTFGPVDAALGASGKGGAPAVAEMAGREDIARQLRQHPALGAAAEVALGAGADVVLEGARGVRAADEAAGAARTPTEDGTESLEDVSDVQLLELSDRAARLGDDELSRRAGREIDRRATERADAGEPLTREAEEPTEEPIDQENLFRPSEEPDPAAEGGFAQLPGEDYFRPLKQLGEEAESWWTRNFTTAGDLPQEAFERKVQKRGAIQAELQQKTEVLRDFDRALKEAKGSSRLNEDEARLLDRALKGERPMSDVPEPVQPVLRRMRDHIDALSQRFIDEGVVEGHLAAKIEKNKGFYANRSYQVFDDPDWAEKVPKDVRNKAKGWLRGQIKRRERPDLFEGTLSDDELERRAQRIIEELLHREEDSPLQFLASGKVGSKDLSILKTREKIAPEIRALLGEFEDPRVNYGRSVAKMAQLVESHNFLRDVREQGLGRWLFEPEDAPPEAHAEIATEGSAVMEPLNGLRTTSEIKEAFEEGAWRAPAMLRPYMAALGSVKAAKTVFSPMTHVRNFIGNPMFLIANGNNPFRHWRKAAAAPSSNVEVVESVGRKLGQDTEAAREYFRRMQRLGVVDESARAGELRDIVQDVMRDGARNHTPTPATDLKDRLAQGTRKFGRESVNLYQSEDDFWKIVAFESEKAKYREALPEAAEEEVERRAAEVVRATLPTYSIVPEAVRKARTFPFTGTFVSFPAEVIRTGFNTIRLTKEELTHANPAIRKIGARRLAGLLTAASSVPAITEASSFITGISQEAKEDIRRFLPPWSENSNIFFLGRDDEGRVQWVDVSYTDPYQYLRKPIMAFLRGEDWQGATIDAATELFKPFVEEEILTSKVVSALRNRTTTGGRVYNPSADGSTVARQVTGHLLEAFEPGAWRSGERIFKGFTGEETPYGRTYDPTQEIAATLTGIRWNSLNPQRSLSFQARDRVATIRDAESMVTSKAASQSDVSLQELADTYDEAERNRLEAWKQAHEDAQAAVRLGVERETVLQTLQAAGFSETDARMVLQGRYKPYQPSGSFFDRRVEEAVAAEGKEGFLQRRRELRSRSAALDSLSRARVRELAGDGPAPSSTSPGD